MAPELTADVLAELERLVWESPQAALEYGVDLFESEDGVEICIHDKDVGVLFRATTGCLPSKTGASAWNDAKLSDEWKLAALLVWLRNHARALLDAARERDTAIAREETTARQLFSEKHAYGEMKAARDLERHQVQDLAAQARGLREALERIASPPNTSRTQLIDVPMEIARHALSTTCPPTATPRELTAADLETPGQYWTRYVETECVVEVEFDDGLPSVRHNGVIVHIPDDAVFIGPLVSPFTPPPATDLKPE